MTLSSSCLVPGPRELRHLEESAFGGMIIMFSRAYRPRPPLGLYPYYMSSKESKVWPWVSVGGHGAEIEGNRGTSGRQ